MNILILGSGGREHALYEACEINNRVYMLGDNGAINQEYLINDIDLFDFDAILAKINQLKINLTIVGPESYLNIGIVNFLKANNKEVFGPSKQMAKLESSKSYAKMIMKAANIPTAKYEFTYDYEKAIDICDKFGYPVVIKYNGLAGGKGVLVAESHLEALNFLHQCPKFGDEGVVIEECLFGDEYSVFAMIKGSKFQILPVAQDYKRAYDGDTGPNTGGMGANTTNKYDDQLPLIKEQIIKPLIHELDYEYEGFLYIGLMQTTLGPKVIEFNVRMGDPETQVVLQKLKTPLTDIISNLDDNKLIEIEIDPLEYVGVVFASEGYPGKYKTNLNITSLKNLPNMYHMGTKLIDEKLYSTGGRIGMLTASGLTKLEAINKIYKIISVLQLDNIHYRNDIVHSKIDIDEIF